MGGKLPTTVHWYTIGWLRRLYDWTLDVARTKNGPRVLFLVALLESSIFPVPPDAVLLCLGMARPKRSLWYGALATVGSVLGGLIGYIIGMVFFSSLGQWILDVFSLREKFAYVGVLFSKHAFLTILGAAFTPIPYKVLTIASGFWSINIVVFLAASLLGRGARFALEAVFLYYGGPSIARFIDRWFGWITLGVFILLVAIVVFIGFIGQ